MTRLQKESDIWVLSPTAKDLQAGASYAAMTLPWTFNRMMKNTGPNGQRERGLNIAKGIVGQEMLKLALQQRGIKVKTQRKSHRDEDLFDFRISMDDRDVLLDVKTFHHYSDYGIEGIKPLSKKIIIDNAGYPGPDWRRFFPMLIAHTQILQQKEYYFFAMASSIDPRKDLDNGRSAYAITAFPYGEYLPFFSSKRLCLAREEAGKGIFLRVRYERGGLFNGVNIAVRILGEWDGKSRIEEVVLGSSPTANAIGPFSCVNSFQIDRNTYEMLEGTVHISVGSNKFQSPVLDSTKANVNVAPSAEMPINRLGFCNLILPSDYKLYCIGWLPKTEFLTQLRKYKGWIWPNDSIDRFKNQAWSQITANDRKTFSRVGLADCLTYKPSAVNAGWMKTSGHGPGACCYVFPNTGHHGGVKETNLYVLPQDLFTMACIKDI
jgi:hypothetical protein